MSRQQGKVERPFEYCLERSELALKDELIPELRQEIIHRELLPDKVWREAKRRLQKRTTADLSTEDEALARSYWWLAKTKRDYKERFEKEVQKMGSTNYPLEEKKKDKRERLTVEVMLPLDAEVHVFPVTFAGLRAQLRITGASAGISTAIVCEKLLSQLVKADSKDFDWVEESRIQPEVSGLKGLMIQALKKFGLEPFIEVLEKNGIKVKICGNCRFVRENLTEYCCTYITDEDRKERKTYHRLAVTIGGDDEGTKDEIVKMTHLLASCEHWALKEKEVSESKNANCVIPCDIQGCDGILEKIDVDPNRYRCSICGNTYREVDGKILLFVGGPQYPD